MPTSSTSSETFLDLSDPITSTLSRSPQPGLHKNGQDGFTTWLSFSDQWCSSEALNKDTTDGNTRAILEFSNGNSSSYFFKGVIEKDKEI